MSMIKYIPPKDFIYKKCCALFLKRIGDYMVWLTYYYKTWDYCRCGPYSAYIPHFFVH